MFLNMWLFATNVGQILLKNVHRN